jgi:hypothetical protein
MKLASLQPLTPGFVNGLTEKVEEDLEEGTKEELDESPGRGADEYNKGGQHRGGGVKGGGEPVNELVYRGEDEELESELGATEDELGDEDALADEEGAELDDVEGAEVDAEVETSLTIRQVVSAIEAALEELLPNEEVDAEYVGDDDMDVEAEEEFAPEGDEVVADIEVGEEELEEVLGFGKSKEEKEQEKKDIKALSVTSPERTAYDKKTGGSGAQKIGRPSRYSVDSSAATYKESTENTDELVEQITKRVAARILKSALAKK